MLKAERNFALKFDGSTWSVLANASAQLVDNLTREKSLPAVITDISGKARHNMLIDENGGLWSWGHNANGELGDGTNISRDTPARKLTAAQTGADEQAAAMPAVRRVVAGDGSTVALTTDGSV